MLQLRLITFSGVPQPLLAGTRLIFVLFALFFAAQLTAQFPALSPRAEIRQDVGNTIIRLEYERPIARGRKIFGELVPYGQAWQTGAGATFIHFNRPVTIAQQQLPAGDYALVTIPDKTEWTIIIHDAMHGSMRYDKSTVKVQTCVPVSKPSRFYEALSIEFDLSPTAARMYISWTDVQVSIPIETTTTAQNMAIIDSLIASKGAYSEDAYFRAANYLLFNNIEQAKALAIIKRMQENNPGEYPYRMLMRVNLELGNKEAALAAAKGGMAAAKKEYADQPDRLASILNSYEEQRTMIVAGTADGRKSW